MARPFPPLPRCLPATSQDLAYFDDTTNQWVAEAGTFEVLVGSSSRDIRLGGSFELVP